MHYLSCFYDQIPEKKQLKGERPYFVFEGRAYHGDGGADVMVVRDRNREAETERHIWRITETEIETERDTERQT